MKDIRGCNALLTGASRGIGVSIAHRLAEEGVNLALVARTADALEGVRSELLHKGIRAIAAPADLSHLDSLGSLVQEVERKLGPIDLLINNAALESFTMYESLSIEEMKTMIDVNLSAPMILSRLILPGMLSRKRGHIVNISSSEGLLPLPFSETYTATKHGLIGFTYCLHLSLQLRQSPVSSSVICPGAISGVGMFQRYVDRYKEKIAAPDIFGTYKPQDVANAVIQAIIQDRTIIIVGRSILPVHFLLYAVPRLVGQGVSVFSWLNSVKNLVESNVLDRR